MFSWNCGGLPASKYDELLTYCSSEGIDLLAVQETRRSASQVWKSGDYTVFQSGEGSTGTCYSGLLLAARHVISSRHEHVLPGRVLYVQLTLKGVASQLDVVLIYQRCYPLQADERTLAAAVEARRDTWDAVESVLKRVPRRNAVFVLGDLNTHLGRSPPHTLCNDPSGAISDDAEVLQELLSRHALVPLHRGQGANAVTYSASSSSRSGTRIDYVYCRDHMLPSCSDATITWHLPFMQQNSFGTHGALTGLFRSSWTTWRTGRTSTPRPTLV